MREHLHLLPKITDDLVEFLNFALKTVERRGQFFDMRVEFTLMATFSLGMEFLLEFLGVSGEPFGPVVIAGSAQVLDGLAKVMQSPFDVLAFLGMTISTPRAIP